MKKFEITKIDDLADIFYALMGDRNDDIRVIDAFMQNSPLKQLLYASDVERILKFDGFFADEVVDAVYALLPVKIPLSEERSWIMSPQAFRKLNQARISRPASRLINISFPKAFAIYNSLYVSKVQEVIAEVRSVQQQKENTPPQPVKETQSNTPHPAILPPVEKHLPPVVEARLKKVSQDNPMPKKRDTPLLIAPSKARKLKEEELRKQQQEKQEVLKQQQEPKKETKKQPKNKTKEILPPLSEEEKQRFNKYRRDFRKAKKEQEKRRFERETLKQQQNEENLRRIEEEKKRNEEEKKRLQKKQEVKRKNVAKKDPKLAEKREKNRLRMQKKRAENPEARKRKYVKYEDLSPEELEIQRQKNRERNRLYRERHRLELRQAYKERRAKLKAENPELLQELDKKNNQKANRKEISRRYYQNHKEELNQKTKNNPMRKIYLQRYDEKKKQKNSPTLNILLDKINNSR